VVNYRVDHVVDIDCGYDLWFKGAGLAPQHGLGEQCLLNCCPGARHSERLQSHILKALDQQFHVLLLILRQVYHAGLQHIFGAYRQRII
jgi:hypothetical protein